MRLAGTLSAITTVQDLQTWIRARRATLLVYSQGKAYLAEVRCPGVALLAHGATLSEAVERVTRRFDQECREPDDGAALCDLQDVIEEQPDEEGS